MKNEMYSIKSVTSTIFILFVISIFSLHSQDYLITFAGAGASTTVDSVKIENLMQGTKLKMKGSDILRLTVVTGIEAMSENETGKISFYPNPMKDYAKMQFVLPEPGETMVSLYDISGREITHTKDLLTGGKHVYAINGLKEGIYLAKVNSGRYSCTGRLISSGSRGAGIKIVYENTLTLHQKQYDSKGTNEEKIMQYHTGDRLLMKGISGIYSTVVTDVPTAGKTITFNFIGCTDGDGNNYPIVQIGTAKGTTDKLDQEGEKASQIWMAENLKTTKYKDFTSIPNVTVNETWAGLITPAYCWYNNDIGNKNVYGALYNWYTLTTGKLCPEGWHMPTDAEWKTLTDFLGGTSTAGFKLKETGIIHWTSPNNWASNETGFTALPGGRRLNFGFDHLHNLGTIWSSTEISSTNASYRTMSYLNSNTDRNDYFKSGGFSVRCLKD